MEYLLLVSGLLLLVAGGEAVVWGAVAFARYMRMSPLLIGLTLVGFGTSLPELVTSVEAAILGSPGIAIGNIIGSNIANILLILGIAAIISPIAIAPSAFKRDGGFVVFTALVCAAFVASDKLNRLTGIFLLIMLVIYVVYTYLHERSHSDGAAPDRIADVPTFIPTSHRPIIAIVLLVMGLIITVLGSHFFVRGSLGLAHQYGISETLIGLTIVAIGTSLPELTISVLAATKRQSEVAFGNILGSNIFNISGILGVTGIICPVPIPPEILQIDLWVMLGATFLLLLFAVSEWNINRKEGVVFLLGYALYIGYLTS